MLCACTAQCMRALPAVVPCPRVLLLLLCVSLQMAGLTRNSRVRTLHERRRVHPIGGNTDRHGRVGKPNCDAAPPSRSAVCHYWGAIYSRGTGLRHADRDAGLLAACRCHLVPPPATSADAACVAKTKCRNCTLCFFASPQGPKGYRAHGQNEIMHAYGPESTPIAQGLVKDINAKAHGQNEIMHAYGPESTPIGRMYMCGCVCGCMQTCRGV